MLITKFNKMIRNRVLWGALVALIGISMVGYIGPRYGCSRNRAERRAGTAEGSLFGKDVTPQEFSTARFYEMGMREDNAPRTPAHEEELRQRAWKRLAVLHMAGEMGITTSDEEVGEALRRDPAFRVNGAFDKQRYQAVIQSQLRVPVEIFEEYVRKTLTIRKVVNALESITWTSPSELRSRLSNLTDTLSIQYALIPKDASLDKVQVTAEEAEKFYAAHTNRFTIPSKVSVRYVAFPVETGAGTNEITDTDLSAYYDDHIEEYSTTDTNGLTVALPLAEVREDIAGRLARQAALFKTKDAATEFAMTMAPDREGNAPSFTEAAAKAKLEIHTTDLFSASERVKGLDVDFDFNRTAFSLDTNDPERAVSDAIVGSNAVYVITVSSREDAHTPEFKDVSDAVMPIVTSNAQHEAFLKRASSLREGIAAGMTGGKTFMDAAKGMALNVSTTAPFSVYESMTSSNAFKHAELIIPKLVALQKGDLSDPVETPEGVLLATVVDRKPGDFAAAQMLTPELLRTIESYRSGIVFEDWTDHLLKAGKLQDDRAVKLGAEPADESQGTDAPTAKDHAGDLL